MEGTISNGTQILTTDGIPLKVSLRKTERKNKIRAFLLVFPLLLFIVVTFVVPIADMLFRSVDDSHINTVFPNTFEEYAKWDREDLPPEAVYKSLFLELATGEGIQVGKALTRMNYSKSGWKSLIKKTRRQVKKIYKSGEEPSSYKQTMIEINKGWADPTFWIAMAQMLNETTLIYYWNAIDRTYDIDQKVIMQNEERRMYVKTWWRTFKVSIYVTFFCLVLGFPVAHLLANLPLRYSNLLMIFVLLPFWTSLLVRTTAWIVMLQQKGVINGVLVWLGILGDDQRIQMVYNMTGTIIAMTQILLPFMILPLYSVMKVIPKSHMRAAQNLGAKPATAFFKVYLPQTVPGMSAGGLLVFVLAIGYFITPELVGGKDGQLIGHWIAYHLKTTLNWGLCSALGSILLAVMLVLYWLYNKIVGIDNIKLG
ncbi:MAG: Putrescine transport system permease protein PotH [Alphaproteobacteria bacterium MarineAlpha5_Bin11]|nr:polyamine ABC transporter substrate-binding protein [Pelagibacteraceae bacterium]PPR43398.1 MAG: Putrescine transport system permease protein PotH [Alphaproteobacteria bacterium MarineAlpha5_Bin11]PPR51730.1 MAG: Putrescine transport system permease protein PotH [Alphaproteobacteria bacterium MarineAlpha5_Bin10]